jgi:hypothetical protein
MRTPEAAMAKIMMAPVFTVHVLHDSPVDDQRAICRVVAESVCFSNL